MEKETHPSRRRHHRHHHFLVATFPFQGHINPALHLAKHLARTAPADVTFSTAVFAHRRMFPSSSQCSHGEEDVHDGLISYVPFSDGFDDGDGHEFNPYMEKFKLHGSNSLSAVVGSLAARGRPVTCIIYTMLLPWAAEVAREHGVPSVHYWIQPATVFAMYYHYFHSYRSVIDSNRQNPAFVVNLPGLPPVRIQDLPSFLLKSEDDQFYSVLLALREGFDLLNSEIMAAVGAKPRVLVNTFDALEAEVLTAINKELKLIAIGPLSPPENITAGTNSKDISAVNAGGDIFKPDEKVYMEWLETKPELSVVYISFGSLHKMKKKQMEEMLAGLQESGRPYLWVVRKDNREEGFDLDKATAAAAADVNGKRAAGMVVEWCNQVKVLSHPSVGCFVTHCGWNSMLESLASGIPVVGVPQLSDQATNALLAEAVWGTGLRAELSEEGLMERKELERCLGIVMGEEEEIGGVKMMIRRNVTMWKEKARDAISEGGSSDRNLRAFLEEISKS